MTATNTTDHDAIFDAAFLDRLRTLFFKLRKRRQMQRRGVQQTPSTGFTREFKDHRQYSAGDDYRGIDWRLYARLDRLFIRLFEEIQEFHVHVLVDTSLSMADPFPAKRVAALRLAAALSYLAMVNGHRVSVFTLADSIRRELPPLKGQGHVHELLDRLAALPFAQPSNLEASLRQFRPASDRKGIVFVVSDLFGKSPQSACEAIDSLGRFPSECHVLHVLEPAEIEPDLAGELQLFDVETGETRRMWLTQRDMERYRESVEKWMEDLRQACVRQRVDYVSWRTDTPFEQGFLNLLSRGSALAKA